jgi:mRNA-degrading endonuclease RelE of RelBE toxin-antitoxin system
VPYRVELVSRAEKDIKRLDHQMRDTVRDLLADLAVTPRPHGVTQLDKNTYRLRTTYIRIIYEVDDDRQVITVYKAQKRGEIYRS